MTISNRLLAVGAVALIGSLLEAGTTSAHANEQHATGGVSGTFGVVMVAVVIAVAVAYRLTNRAARLPRQMICESEGELECTTITSTS